MKNLVWFDARSLKNEEIILPLIFNMHFEYLLVDISAYKKMNCPQKMKFIVEVNDEESLRELDTTVVVLAGNNDLLGKAMDNGYRTALYKRITCQEDMNIAWKEGENHDFLVIELKDETNIPLELLIARLQNKNTALLKKVKTLEEIEIAFGVMEVGSDGVLFSCDDVKEILEVNKYMSQSELGKLELVKAKVTCVEHIGMGYRSCIDTTNIMQSNEGMLIGSTSNGGLLVSSETHFLPYMELRPFRVNAGAVHSYVWAPDGMTYYLTELKAGSKVLCVDTEGNTRVVSVGRVKTELRPLLKIEAEAKDLKINAIVQDDWHIRIFGDNGEVRNASTIKVGDELLAYVCSGGRHVGVKIEESIEER